MQTAIFKFVVTHTLIFKIVDCLYQDFLISLDVLKFKDAKSLEITKEASVVVDQFFAYLMSHIKYHAAQKADNVSNISSSHGSSISALPGYQITGPSKEVTMT